MKSHVQTIAATSVINHHCRRRQIIKPDVSRLSLTNQRRTLNVWQIAYLLFAEPGSGRQMLFLDH